MIWIRVTIAVLLGYMLMWLSFAVTMVSAITLVSPDRLRDAETGMMTNWFIFVVQFPVALFTAVIGGLVAALLASAKGRKHAIKGLVGFVIIVGIIGGLGGSGSRLVDEIESVSQNGDATGLTPADSVAVDPSGTPPERPIWNLFLLPFVGGLGVLLGGRSVIRAATAFSLDPTLPSSSPPPSPPASPAS